MTVANEIASGLSKMKSGAQGALDKVSKAAAPVVEGLDMVLEQVPAMLVCFVSPKVPVPFAAIPIMFNPEKLKFSKQSKWLKTKTAKRNAPTSRFGGGEAERFNLKLFLDSSKAGVLGVGGYIWILKQLMKAPPVLLVGARRHGLLLHAFHPAQLVGVARPAPGALQQRRQKHFTFGVKIPFFHGQALAADGRR